MMILYEVVLRNFILAGKYTSDTLLFYLYKNIYLNTCLEGILKEIKSSSYIYWTLNSLFNNSLLVQLVCRNAIFITHCISTLNHITSRTDCLKNNFWGIIFGKEWAQSQWSLAVMKGDWQQMGSSIKKHDMSTIMGEKAAQWHNIFTPTSDRKLLLSISLYFGGTEEVWASKQCTSVLTYWHFELTGKDESWVLWYVTYGWPISVKVCSPLQQIALFMVNTIVLCICMQPFSRARFLWSPHLWLTVTDTVLMNHSIKWFKITCSGEKNLGYFH